MKSLRGIPCSNRQDLWRARSCLPEFAVVVDTFVPNARVAVLADGPEIVGFFPFQRRRLGVGIPIGTPTNECQGLIHKPGVELDARELLRACKLSVWQFDCLAEGQQPFARFVTEVAPQCHVDERFRV